MSAPEMPERIWLIPDIGWDGETAWSNDPAPEPGMDPDNATEYLRSDLCALTPAPQPEGQVQDLYLICKYGRYYRPNAQGYTNDVAEAGRYTLDEAIRHTHPNGPDGPRDGMTYIPAPAPSAATPTAQEAVAWAYYWPDGGLMDVLTTAVSPYETLRQVPLYAHPPQPSETVAEALAEENRRLRDALRGMVGLYESDGGTRSLPEVVAARSALSSTGEKR